MREVTNFRYLWCMPYAVRDYVKLSALAAASVVIELHEEPRVSPFKIDALVQP